MRGQTARLPVREDRSRDAQAQILFVAMVSSLSKDVEPLDSIELTYPPLRRTSSTGGLCEDMGKKKREARSLRPIECERQIGLDQPVMLNALLGEPRRGHEDRVSYNQFAVLV